MTQKVTEVRAFFVGLVLCLTVVPVAAHAGRDRAAERESLKKTLAEVIRRTSAKSARASVFVQSLDDGAVIFAQNEDELLNPASNMKLVTAAAAISKLGLDYRYETEFLSEAELSGGKVKNLYVRGKGDPTVTTEKLYSIVSELLHAGLREVTGDLVVDESFFDGERNAPGYDQDHSDNPYMAPSGAVSLNWNAVAVYLRPGDKAGSKAVVEIEPPSDYISVDSALTTGARRYRRFSVKSEPLGDKQQKILVQGTVPDERVWSIYKKIDHPPYYFGQSLKRILNDRGIKMKGRVRLATVPQNAKTLYVWQSETLDIILKQLNKHSSNLIAETLVKTVGAEARGAPGSFAKGIDAIEEFMEKEVGIPRGSYVMKNGSGLNDTNRFSAPQLGKLLRHMNDKFQLAPEFESSLGIAGKDGTVRNRFEGSDAVGRLRAKTGTLENVRALSGSVESVGGEKFVFSLIVNDFSGYGAPITQTLDAMGAAIAASGSVKGPGQAVAEMMNQPTVVGPIDEVRTRVKTYLALGRQRDKRNIPFLRTAWRNEKDPAVRAVVAESIYQSNPQDYLGPRTLLDSFSSGNEVYGRLRQVAKDLSIEVPCIPSMIELAAEGNAEALTKLVEVTRTSGADEASQRELAEALGEVSRTAPEELLLALKLANNPDRDSAMILLARGLIAANDADHPFWPTLRKMMGAVDASTADFAKKTDTVLSLKIAEEKAPKLPAPVTAQPSNKPPPDQRVTETRPGG
ncbi:MAG: D-alanyl-D-alanine carboxypeptidase/D-alanyl-D-alanine endopeptidase [Myxococcaceae bacterium]